MRFVSYEHVALNVCAGAQALIARDEREMLRKTVEDMAWGVVCR
jgi:hypothetical protein